MAHVENTVMDVYYRNDSMKSVVYPSLVLLLSPKAWLRSEASHGRGGIWYLQSRVKKRKRGSLRWVRIYTRSAWLRGC